MAIGEVLVNQVKKKKKEIKKTKGPSGISPPPPRDLLFFSTLFTFNP